MRRRPSASALVTLVVLAGATLFIFAQLQPHLLFANTTPSGGDMGAHVWGPAYLRDHLLPHGRISGWTPDWYAGFPYLTFYFPLPSLVVVLLNVVLPYGIAFKLVTVLGLLTLPLAAWAFGKLSDLPAPGPLCLAVATVPFMFDRTFTIYGGNIPSTLAGEFAFSISLSLMLVFLGVFARGLRTGRHKGLAAVLLALTAACHIVPVFYGLAGAGVLTLLHLRRRNRLSWSISALAVGGLLAAFWVVPFMLRIAYTNDMGWEKIVTYKSTLLPSADRWVAMLAGIGALVSIAARRRSGIFLASMATLSAAAFIWAPEGRLWNARLLPFWVLTLYLLAGVAVSEMSRAVGLLVSKADRLDDAERWSSAAVPVIALVAAMAFVAFPLHIEPFGHDNGTTYSWLGLKTTDRSFIADWAKWNYTGYERKAAYPEYKDLVSTMGAVGKQDGCGRAM